MTIPEQDTLDKIRRLISSRYSKFREEYKSNDYDWCKLEEGGLVSLFPMPNKKTYRLHIILGSMSAFCLSRPNKFICLNDPAWRTEDTMFSSVEEAFDCLDSFISPHPTDEW